LRVGSAITNYFIIPYEICQDPISQNSFPRSHRAESEQDQNSIVNAGNCDWGGGGNCDPITNGGTDCLACHTHVDNFAASGGGCTGCHSSTQGGAPPLDRREIVSEFSRLTHHVGGTLADSDCQVCHQQMQTSILIGFGILIFNCWEPLSEIPISKAAVLLSV